MIASPDKALPDASQPRMCRTATHAEQPVPVGDEWSSLATFASFHAEAVQQGDNRRVAHGVADRCNLPANASADIRFRRCHRPVTDQPLPMPERNWMQGIAIHLE